ncbi:hypothetical protein G6O69_24910 [Pseudenhygromyxa sp. WMMC2535]|uniref:hypothetical protein n=1 Tax=Pseudenhygromyxa sp. WMMC2535 TaxID=2712867 RepID=UPI001554471B|nr:hypothetical protein [Pseudenhygromyxa sp. WMMC2535]NVB41104.1 hypothetical protein [Pseudenhygromyxa sp. WMMC2535]
MSVDKLRVRLELPPWMLGWPRGLRPHALHTTTHSLELLYRLPEDRWVCVALRLEGGRARVRELLSHHDDAAARERLCRAITRKLAGSRGQAEAWMRTRGQEIAALEQKLADEEAPGDARWLRTLRCARAQAWERALDVLLAEAEERGSRSGGGASRVAIDDVALATAGIPLALASGDFARALGLWSAAGQQLLASEHDASAQLCAAVMLAFLGAREQASARAASFAAAVRDFEEERRCGELFEFLDMPAQALPHFELVAARGRRFDDEFRVARQALLADASQRAAVAGARMIALARGLEARLEGVDLLVRAGAFLQAERVLSELAEHEPEHEPGALEIGVRLAGLQLWRGEAEQARARADALLAAGHDRLELHRIRGVASLMLGEPEQACAALELAVGYEVQRPWGMDTDEESKLWFAQALLESGEIDRAHREIARCRFGDHTAWQLLRALIEERHEPGRVINLDTWFIADSLLEQLLGARWRERAGAPGLPTHEQATEALRQALARLGGNRGARLSVLVEPDRFGESEPLRWIDEILPPRRRAEELQKRLAIEGVEALRRAFGGLERRHPQVPFNITYSAELLLWMGDYEGALARFRDVWTRTRTRWGYIGSGACLLYLGRYDEALAIWEEGSKHYIYLEAEATYAYRGELHRLRDDLDEARADLEHAVKHRPARLGAWSELALACVSAGELARAREAAAEVWTLAPAMVWIAQERAGVTPSLALPEESSALTRVLEVLRDAMKGNRSSVTYTLVDEAGSLRIFPRGNLDAWRQYGRGLGDYAQRELLRRTLASGAR